MCVSEGARCLTVETHTSEKHIEMFRAVKHQPQKHIRADSGWSGLGICGVLLASWRVYSVIMVLSNTACLALRESPLLLIHTI